MKYNYWKEGTSVILKALLVSSYIQMYAIMIKTLFFLFHLFFILLYKKQIREREKRETVCLKRERERERERPYACKQKREIDRERQFM